MSGQPGGKQRINSAPELRAASSELKDRGILKNVRNIWIVQYTANSGRFFVVTQYFLFISVMSDGFS